MLSSLRRHSNPRLECHTLLINTRPEQALCPQTHVGLRYPHDGPQGSRFQVQPPVNCLQDLNQSVDLDAVRSLSRKEMPAQSTT